MDSIKAGFVTIDEYIATYPEDIQKSLEELRATIHAAVPEATEKISYQMPTFYLKGNLVSFGAFSDHISFFPGAIVNILAAFGDEVSAYMTGKGTLQFPLGKPVPLDLVSKISKVRAEQNLKKAREKAARRKKKEA